MQKAAIYCRSSKDRAEVGLDAQRSELRAFAKRQGLAIAAEFSDMEISGSLDETSRPGLRDLLAALRAPDRPWKVLLALDPSRIARDPMLGLYITRECEKHGVEVRYAKLPVDGSSAFGETMLSVVRAFDRLHARLSGEKGRSGLVANLAKGFRAGGRAPLGYKLHREGTGATRGGQEVRKSRLVLDPKPAAQVKTFLKARAAGVPRSEAARRARLDGKPVATLIGIERNALVYAGFQTWNLRRRVKPTREDPRRTMEWRPRSEWIVSEAPTHEPLITRDEAERILALHETRGPRGPRVRKPDEFILSGVMFTPDGRQWHGDAHDACYRAGAKGRRVNARWIEGSILAKVATDFADPAFLARTVAEARRMAEGIEADPQALDDEIRRLERQVNHLVDAVAEGADQPKALLEKIRAAETQLESLRRDKAAWQERATLKRQLLAIDESSVRELLRLNAIERRDGGGLFELLDLPQDQVLAAGELRRLLTTIIERVELDPDSREFALKYRLPVTGVKLASPRGLAANSGGAPALTIISKARLPKRAPRALGARAA